MLFCKDILFCIFYTKLLLKCKFWDIFQWHISLESASLWFEFLCHHLAWNPYCICHIFTITAWNKDFKPGPYPETEEERQRAARKYGLRVDEYKPVPDDGLGAGDYPDVPLVSAESRNPFTNWDYPEHRRNFGEPVGMIYSIVMDYLPKCYGIITI